MTIKGPMPKWSLLPIDSAASKVIIHKLRGEISLVEQEKIECVSVAYLKFMFKFQSKNLISFHFSF